VRDGAKLLAAQAQELAVSNCMQVHGTWLLAQNERLADAAAPEVFEQDVPRTALVDERSPKTAVKNHEEGYVRLAASNDKRAPLDVDRLHGLGQLFHGASWKALEDGSRRK
jgi:hypothetical protein